MDPNARGPRSYTWVFGFFALAVLLFMVWMVWPGGDGGEGTDVIDAAREVEEVEPIQPPTGGTVLPVPEIAETPQQYESRIVSGTAFVEEVASDAGFWVGGDGTRLFVMVDRDGGPAPPLEADTEVHLSEARVRTIESAADLTALPADVREILANQRVYLVAAGPAILRSTPR